MEKNVFFFDSNLKKKKNNFSTINYIISLIYFILNGNLSSRRKILNASLVLLIASFLIKKLFSLPFVDPIYEYIQNLIIPIIILIINNSEGPGEPIAIHNDNQGNNDDTNENANDLANERNNQEAIPPTQANQKNQKQLNKGYD